MDQSTEKFLKIIELHLSQKGVLPKRGEIDRFARDNGFPFKVGYYLSTRHPKVPFHEVMALFGYSVPSPKEHAAAAAQAAVAYFEAIRPTRASFVHSIKEVAKLLGHTPTPVQYDSLAKEGPALSGGFHNWRRLLASEYPSYAAFFIAENIPLPPAENMRILEKVESLGLDKYRPEWVVPGSQFRVDFLIEHAGLIFGLEVDGSSHISPASKFHAAPYLNGGLTPDESFKKKRDRDVWVNAWFEENKTPLLRVSPVALYRMTSARDLLERISKTGFVSKVKVYLVTEAAIRELVNLGYTDSSLAAHFGMSKRAIGMHRRRYGIPSAYEIQKNVSRNRS